MQLWGFIREFLWKLHFFHFFAFFAFFCIFIALHFLRVKFAFSPPPPPAHSRWGSVSPTSVQISNYILAGCGFSGDGFKNNYKECNHQEYCKGLGRTAAYAFEPPPKKIESDYYHNKCLMHMMMKYLTLMVIYMMLISQDWTIQSVSWIPFLPTLEIKAVQKKWNMETV